MNDLIFEGSEERASKAKSGSTLPSRCQECKSKKIVLQRAAVRHAPEIVPPIVHDKLRSPGQSLDPVTRVFKEPRFEHDFTHTRVHNDAKAAESKSGQVTQRLMRSGSLQTKLNIDDIGDTFEKEASRVAQHVMLLPTPHSEEPDRFPFQRQTRAEIGNSKMKCPANTAEPFLQSIQLPLKAQQMNGFSEMQVKRGSTHILIPISQCQQQLQLQLQSAPNTTTAEITKAEIEQATEEEARQSSAKAGSLRVHYEKIAKETIEKGKMEFSALNLDKEHREVKEENTPLKQEEVVDAIRSAWKAVFNKPISPKFLALMIGKWKTEGGIKGIYNYNIGNLQVDVGTKERPKAPTSDYAWRSASEITRGREEKKRSRFAAYDSIFQGAMGLIHYIVTNRPALWAAGESGNVEHYVYVMKSYNYFTAPVEDVKVRGKTVKTGYLTLMRSTTPRAETLEEPPSSEGPKAAEDTPADSSDANIPNESGSGGAGGSSDYGSGGSGGAGGSSDYGSGGARGAGGGPAGS